MVVTVGEVEMMEGARVDAVLSQRSLSTPVDGSFSICSNQWSKMLLGRSLDSIAQIQEQEMRGMEC